jgi:hypothetical protein
MSADACAADCDGVCAYPGLPDHEKPAGCVSISASENTVILDRTADAIRDYVVVADAQRDALALWAAHCHAFDAAEATPYLHIKSVMRESGKTRLLEVLEILTPRAVKVGATTSAALARSVSQDPPPTFMLDESDNTFKRDKEYVATMLSVLNDGYRRGGKTLLCLPPKWEPAYLEVFSPKAIAGLGNLPDTVASRSIPIELKRRTASETVKRFRLRDATARLAPIHDALALWAGENVDALADARPELPDELGDRAQDVWEPLLAIADLVGGDWPERARTAAIELSSSAGAEEESLRVRLLFDIRLHFDRKNIKSVWSKDLVEALNDDEEAPWGDLYGKALTARSLAKMLRPFGIRPRSVRSGESEKTSKGYLREQFDDAFERYLVDDEKADPGPGTPNTPSGSGTSGTSQYPSQKQPISIRHNEVSVPDSEQASIPHEQTVVPDVPDKKGVDGVSGLLLNQNGRCLRHPDEPREWCTECILAGEGAGTA